MANSGFPQLCPPGGRRLLTLYLGTAELPENIVLCPRPPGGTLRPPGFVRPGGGLPRAGPVRAGPGLYPGRGRRSPAGGLSLWLPA